MGLEDNTISFSRRNLPHWLVVEGVYFITMRLKGSLPEKILVELKEEKEKFESGEVIDVRGAAEIQRNRFRRIEAVLDACQDSPKWLTRPDVADILMKSFDWLSSKGWRVYGVIMPNHLHLLMTSRTGRSGKLVEDLGQFKNYTGREANVILKRTGPFWMPENFDHWCRSFEKSESAKRYIVNNPVKAGLVQQPEDWPYYVDLEGKVR